MVHRKCLLLLLVLGTLVHSGEIVCEGTYKHHLQGVAADAQGNLFWSYTTTLVQTDAAGKALVTISVAYHHGDLTCRDGKVFVAVNLGSFNQPAGKANSWVYVYNAKDLKLLAKHKTPEVVHGAGGIARKDKGFLVVGGLPKGVKENYAYEYDSEFRFVKRHVIASGYTLLGIQAACRVQKGWLFACYGKQLLRVDDSFRLVSSRPFDGAIGMVPLGKGEFQIARHFGKEKYRARLLPFRADDAKGMVAE